MIRILLRDIFQSSKNLPDGKKKYVFPPHSKIATSNPAVGYISVFSLLFVSLLMREREGTEPCIRFIQREKRDPRKGVSRNRKHRKPEGKGPVRGFFGKHQRSV